MSRKAREKISGIYAIACPVSGYRYIGSGRDVMTRLNHHKARLEAGRSHNPILQFAWNMFGSEGWRFEIIEMCSPEELREREQFWLSQGGNLFNILRDPRRPPVASEATRRFLSEKAKAQHAAGNLGRRK